MSRSEDSENHFLLNPTSLSRESIPLDILYQDEFLVAVNKPTGMLVHRGGAGNRSEPALLQTLRNQLNCRVYPVHRLDQPTSGIVLFGLNSAAAAAMVEQFTQRRVAKYYQALVRGWMHREGCIRIPLIPTLDNTSPPLASATQPAVTEYAAIRWFEFSEWEEKGLPGSFSLVELRPRTGRWHQLRRHLKHIAHPILGDYRHGDDRYNHWLEERFGVDRLLLAACLVSFQHPFSGKPISIRAKRGESFDRLLTEWIPHEVCIEPSRLPAQPLSQSMDTDEPSRKLFSP